MWLSEDQARQLTRATDVAWASPMPTQMISNGEYMPLPQTSAQRAVEARIRALGARIAARLGMDYQHFLRTKCALGVAFAAMNDVFGRFFETTPGEATDPSAADAYARQFAGEFVLDAQTHHVRSTYGYHQLLILRRWTQGLNPWGQPWNPAVASLRADLEQFKLDAYIRDIFLDSDTTVAVLSGFTSETDYIEPLTSDEIAQSRDVINELAGSRRVLGHGLFWPGYPGNLEQMDRAATQLRVDGWKGYAVGDLFSESRYAWRMDDEKVAYPAFEKALKYGIRNVCVHKGLVPAFDYTAFSTWRYSMVDDVAQAARDWPQLNFIIYHAALRPLLDATTAADEFRRTGSIPWVTDLAEIPGRYGVDNVYAELGTTFATTVVTFPELTAGILGQCIRGMGADHVLWGTDSVWWGSPQWQIESFRRMEIPEDMRRAHGFEALGPPTGAVKRQILGLNAARLYGIDPAAKHGDVPLDFKDRLAQLKSEYQADEPGLGRTRHGWIKMG